MSKPKKGGQNRIDLGPDDIKRLETMAGLGIPTHHMAAILGIGPATLDRVIKRDKRVAEAIARGAAQASADVRATAYKMATSGKWPAMTIFWLKVRERWREPRFEDDDNPDQSFQLAYKK